MTCAHLLLIGGGSDKPGKEGAVLNKGLPARSVPVHVLGRRHGGAWLATEKNDDRVGLGGDETEEEDILGTAVVAFEDGVAKGGGRVELDLLVTGAHEMVDDVRGRGVTTSAAEPLVACQALSHAAFVVNAAVAEQKG